jgi:2'-5' RNA ligase
MIKYGIVAFPPKQIQDVANSFRKRYDPHYSLIPPHITLKESFEMEPENEEEVRNALKQVANNIKPFTVQINKVSTFAPVTNTIYFKIEPNEQLTALNDKLNQSPFSDNRIHPFVPHITLAQKLVEDEYSDVFGRLKMENFQFEVEIDRFQLLYQLDNGSWTVYESFVFGEE